jgi:small-conductance mechanosensitive channel
MVIYSALRLAIFAVLFLVLSLLNLGHWVVTAILAAVLAFLVSYLVLRGPRERAAQYLADRAARRKATGEKFSREIEDDAAFEDAAVDEAEAASPARSPGAADAEPLRRTGESGRS